MIKATHAESDAPDSVAASSKNLDCWGRDIQAQALRVEVGDGPCFIFPYTHFMFASLEPNEDQEILLISFTTHDVRVRGRGLRTLLNALQKTSVDWIKSLPNRYEKLAAGDAVFVARIDVQELRDESEWENKR